MPNYENGKIYKMVSPSGLTYVGSTTQSLALRKGKHKANYLRWKQGKDESNITSFRLFDEAVDNIDIVLLEEVKCESKEQLHMKERYWIETLDCVNKVIPTRTYSEYRNKYYYPANKEKLIMYQKEYRNSEQNKEKIIQGQKKYREANKDAIRQKKKEYREANKDEIRQKKKEYAERHKEEIRQKTKEYREANKDAIKERKSKVIECECGISYTQCHASRHKRTAKHQNFINQQNQSK
jgi:hypothetical protein